MTMQKRAAIGALIITTMFVLASCASPLPWPESPVHVLEFPEAGPEYPQTREEAMKAIEGHYAHYDVVAYEDELTDPPMRTFIISYGFTDFVIIDNRLYQVDEFLYANYHLNQSIAETSFDPSAVEAIKARVQEVELELVDGKWQLYRHETPVLLGITGDPEQPLSTDPNDPNIIDADGDGKPGVTVGIKIMGLFNHEIYIARREIYRNYMTLQAGGIISGHVRDFSEQLIIDATMAQLRQPSNNVQLDDPGMNPIILVPIDPHIDTREELMSIAPDIFPEEPRFD